MTDDLVSRQAVLDALHTQADYPTEACAVVRRVPAMLDPVRDLAASIAGKLGSAQRGVLLSLTEDWGEASCHQTARRMFYGVTANRYTVVHHRHRTDNCWRLSNLGAAVKAVLAQTPGGGAGNG